MYTESSILDRQKWRCPTQIVQVTTPHRFTFSQGQAWILLRAKSQFMAPLLLRPREHTSSLHDGRDVRVRCLFCLLDVLPKSNAEAGVFVILRIALSHVLRPPMRREFEQAKTGEHHRVGFGFGNATHRPKTCPYRNTRNGAEVVCNDQEWRAQV